METLAESLTARNELAWKKQTPQQRADPSKNAIKHVLNYDKKQETDFDELLRKAVKLLTKSQASPIRNYEELFRKWIIGDDAEESRAKIFASLLLVGLTHQPQVWICLSRQFQLFRDGNRDRDFCDGSLPLSGELISRVFGDSALNNFSVVQHDFCPIDPTEIEVKFRIVAEKLQKIIKDEASSHCETIGDDGEKKEGPENTWYSRTSLWKSFNDHKRLLEDLYVGWSAHRNGIPRVAHDRRVYRDQVHEAATVFTDVVLSCPRTVAVMLNTLPVEQRLWDDLMTTQLSDGKLCLFSKDVAADDALPLHWETVVNRINDEVKQHAFYNEQLRFSPVDFQRRNGNSDEVWWPHKQSPYLPLHRKIYFDRGGFGEVYRIKGDEDYFDSKTARDGEFALKIIQSRDGPTESEWDVARKIQADTVKTGGLLVPSALLRTSDNVYILMPLADCNLLALMSGKDGRRKRLGRHASPSRDIKSQEEHYQSLIPHDHNTRKVVLDWLRNPAEGLRRLHQGLHSEQAQQVKVVHGDVKNTNVLCTFDKQQRKSFLRLADFGVSASRYQARSSSNNDQSKNTSTARTKIRLATNCPNFPPEAEKDHMVDSSADLWGFGTLFAEFVAWMSGGPEALGEFLESRDPPSDKQYRGRCYYREPDGEARLKDGIASWFGSLIARTPDDKDRQLYQCCWDLLRDGLLVCEPEQRITASDLCDGLSLIYNGKAKKLTNLLRSTPVNDESASSSSQHSGRRQSSTTEDGSRIQQGFSAPSGRDSSPEIPNEQTRELDVDDRQPMPTRNFSRPTPDLTAIATDSSQAGQTFAQALKQWRAVDAMRLLRSDTVVLNLDNDGNTALHYAVKCEETILTDLLLQERPRLLHEPNHEGRTALHTCARIDSDSALEHSKLLVNRDARILTMRDRYGKTALQLAQHYGRRELVAFLQWSIHDAQPRVHRSH